MVATWVACLAWAVATWVVEKWVVEKWVARLKNRLSWNLQQPWTNSVFHLKRWLKQLAAAEWVARMEERAGKPSLQPMAP